MKRAYKFRLRPNRSRRRILDSILRLHCELYNAALQERRDAWRISKTSVSYKMQSQQLKDIRKEREDIAGLSFSACQQTLRRLDCSFQAFFRRVKLGHTPGFPRFRSHNRFDTVQYQKIGDGCAYDPERGRAYFKETGWIRVNQHRDIRGEIKTLALKREGDAWYVILSCDEVPVQALPKSKLTGGLDLGVRRLVTTSEGDQYANPRHLEKREEALAKAQQEVERKKKGSKRQLKARAKVRRIHGKIARCRKDNHHKVALDLLMRFDSLMVEDLEPGQMSRSNKGTVEQPGKNVAVKKELNKSIMDTGWASFIGILFAKAESAGREVVMVNPAYTSQECAECQHVCKENRPKTEVFCCVACGHSTDPDWNAARNVHRAGLARQARTASAV